MNSVKNETEWCAPVPCRSMRWTRPIARKPQARYSASRKGGGYFATVNGTLHELALGPDDAPTGPTYLAALDRFREVLSLAGVEKQKDANTVRVVLETSMQHIAARKKPGTVEIRLRSYEPFVDCRPVVPRLAIGERPVASLTHLDVYRFLEHMETVPRPHRRPFIQALKDTGARPGELAAATAADFDEKLGAFVFRKEMTRRSDRFAHKTSKNKDRVIFLSGKTLEAFKELVKQYPTGQLFRRKNGGRPFDKVNFVDRFLKLSRRLRMPNLTAYSYRHTWATEMLKAGMDVDPLASLMGNSAMVIRQHDSHLLADRQGLREKLERFIPLAAGTQTPSPSSGEKG